MVGGYPDIPGRDRAMSHEEVIAAKLNAFSQVQERYVEKRFFYKPCCRYITNSFIILWAVTCALITSIWCIWFDLQLSATNGYENDIESQCTNNKTYDIEYKIIYNYNLTQYSVSSIDGTTENGYEPPNESDSFADNLDVSTRFILAVLYSYILAMFFWQPLVLSCSWIELFI